MKRVLTAVILIPLVLLAVFKAPLWLFALLLAVVAVLSLHEYLAIVKGYGIEPMGAATYGTSVLIMALVLMSNDHRLIHHPGWLWILIPVLGVTLPALLYIGFLIPLVLRNDMKMALPATACSLFGVFYLATPLALLIILRAKQASAILIVFVLFSAWAGDTAAYYVGRSWGRHKLAPVVSPNKTWEGAVASVLASIAVAVLVFQFRLPISMLFSGAEMEYLKSSGFNMPLDRVQWLHVIAIGIVTNVAAQFGDLFESALKRGANVKDSGALLPGHGGVLDRMDALFFAIPAAWYYAILTRFPVHI